MPVKKEQRLWLEILNRSYNHPIKIKKNCVLGFFIIDNKIWGSDETDKKKEFIKKKKRERGGFLNHYDFAYAGRDVVNQAAKVAQGVI